MTTTVKKRKLITVNSYQLQLHHKEDMSKEISLTVPNESYSIKELLTRSALPVVHRLGTFEENSNFDSDDLEKLPHSDLFEREEAAGFYRERAKEIELDLKEREQKAAALAKAEADELNELKVQLRKSKTAGKVKDEKAAREKKLADE